jgi:hypothetical protein
MTMWKQAFREGLVSGSLASLMSSAYLVLAADRRDRPAVPDHAVNHWLFGQRALQQGDPSLRSTAAGYLVHHACSVFWGVLYARVWGGRPGARQPLPAIAGAVATAAVAGLVDHQLTPKRLTAGFEHQLGRPRMVNVYACFALGLAIGSLMMQKR